MSIVDPYASSSSNRAIKSSTASAALPSPIFSRETEAGAVSTMRAEVTHSTVSNLALQLSEAAVRAEHRAGQKNANPPHSLINDNYLANKVQHDAERPSTENPELLARARKATGFVNGADSNPFKGLARDQLNLIVYDDGPSFTINERRAAWEELQSTSSLEANSPKAVPINGRDILISRFYGGVEPPVATPPATVFNGAQNHVDFLTRDDRILISEMYAYAQAQGADLRHVDNVAYRLGDYRHYSDGGQYFSVNSGKGYDQEGYLLTVNFKEEDAATAARILSSSAINSTRVDQGFLRHFLDPGYGALVNASGLAFLEQMVIKFSDEGATQTSLDTKFAAFKFMKVEDNTVFITHKEVQLGPSESLASKTDDGWTLTEFGKSEGYTLDKTTGQLSKPVIVAEDQSLVEPVRETSKHTVLDALNDTPDQPVTRWIWPGHLFKLMKNYKP